MNAVNVTPARLLTDAERAKMHPELAAAFCLTRRYAFLEADREATRVLGLLRINDDGTWLTLTEPSGATSHTENDLTFLAQYWTRLTKWTDADHRAEAARIAIENGVRA